jgi:hypothetical protein
MHLFGLINEYIDTKCAEWETLEKQFTYSDAQLFDLCTHYLSPGANRGSMLVEVN